jgi:hypothetical protein
MTITKKQYIFGTLTIIGLLVIGLASIFAVQTYIKSNEAANNTNKPQVSSDTPITSEGAASERIAEAKKAREIHDYTKAIASYKQARTYYQSKDDTNKVADIDLMLSLLESEQKNFVPQPKPTIAGE